MQPLRHGFDGPNEKAFISFDGTDDFMTSTANNPISSNSYTIFMVAKETGSNVNPQIVYQYKHSTTNLIVGFRAQKFYSAVQNGTQTLLFSDVESSSYGILCTSLSVSGGTGTLTTSVNNGANTVSSIGSWLGSTYDQSEYKFGGDGLTLTTFGAVDVGELIVFNRELTENEKSDIKDYLNKKFKIY